MHTAKSLRCVDIENQKEELQRTRFQGVHGLIGPFDSVFATYCCGIFVPASFVFYIS